MSGYKCKFCRDGDAVPRIQPVLWDYDGTETVEEWIEIPNSSSFNLTEAREYLSVLRELATHEGEITNHRIQWFAVLNGLLLAAFALLWEWHPQGSFALIFIVSVMGIAVTYSCGKSLDLGGDASDTLIALKENCLQDMCDDCQQFYMIPPIMGFERSTEERVELGEKKLTRWGWMPWKALDQIFFWAWISLLGLAIVVHFFLVYEPPRTNQTETKTTIDPSGTVTTTMSVGLSSSSNQGDAQDKQGQTTATTTTVDSTGDMTTTVGNQDRATTTTVDPSGNLTTTTMAPTPSRDKDGQ